MKNTASRRHPITVAQKGQIIQRVIVDGWNIADAAASADVPKRLVEVWVADFRRYGMASLRRDSGHTIAAELLEATVSQPVRWLFRRVAMGLRRVFAIEPHVQLLPLRSSNKDGPR